MAYENERSMRNESQIVLYQPDESIRLEVKLDAQHETEWLTQQQIADLFGTKRPAITKHLNNIYGSGELEKDSICSILEYMGNDGKQRLMDEHDRLFPDAHISIRKWRKESHDRWLVIDDHLYHCGRSLNANGGHKISAITLMGTSPEVILAEME